MLLQYFTVAGLSLLQATSAYVLPREGQVMTFAYGLTFTDGEWLEEGWTPQKGLKKKMEEADKFTCTQKEITSVNDYSPTERWNSVNAADVWANLTWWYQDEVEKGNVNLKFTAWVSDKMHDTENMACHLLKAENGCSGHAKCDDQDGPAVHLILNSISNLNNVRSLITLSQSGLLTHYDRCFGTSIRLSSSRPATWTEMYLHLPTPFLLKRTRTGSQRQ